MRLNERDAWKKGIINQRPVFLRKKCLNVIRVRVWPGNDETDGVDRSNQAGREKETRAGAGEGGGQRERSVNFSKKNPHWWIVYRVPVLPMIPSLNPSPFRFTRLRLYTHAHTYTHIYIFTPSLLFYCTRVPPPSFPGQQSLPKYRGIMLNGGRSKGPTESGGELS